MVYCSRVFVTTARNRQFYNILSWNLYCNKNKGTIFIRKNAKRKKLLVLTCTKKIWGIPPLNPCKAELGLCRAVARPVLARPGPVFQGPVRARRPILARFCACKLARPGPGRKSAARRPSGQNGPSKMF